MASETYIRTFNIYVYSDVKFVLCFIFKPIHQTKPTNQRRKKYYRKKRKIGKEKNKINK